MASNLDFSPEALLDLGFDQRDPRYAYSNMASRASWPLPLDISSAADERRSISPTHNGSHSQYQTAHQNTPTLLTDWPIQQQSQQFQQYIQQNTMMGSQFNAFGS